MYPNSWHFKIIPVLWRVTHSPWGSTSLASFSASELARSVLAGVTARTRQFSLVMNCMIISLIWYSISGGWSPTGTFVIPGRSMRVRFNTVERERGGTCTFDAARRPRCSVSCGFARLSALCIWMTPARACRKNSTERKMVLLVFSIFVWLCCAKWSLSHNLKGADLHASQFAQRAVTA